MTHCVHCGRLVYSDSIVCFQCKGLGAKLEIYDSEDESHDNTSFSDIFLGGANYKKMRRNNIQSL